MFKNLFAMFSWKQLAYAEMSNLLDEIEKYPTDKLHEMLEMKRSDLKKWAGIE